MIREVIMLYSYDFDNNSFYESNQYIQNGTTNDSTAPTKGFYPLNKPGEFS